MKFLKVLLIIVVILFAGYSIWMATIPADYEVERTVTVEAPREVVFSEVSDFKNWEAWSYWHKQDSTMKLSYGENTTGEGASYSWTSENMGAGTQTFKKLLPYDTIKTHIDFDGQGEGYGTWIFTDAGDQKTTVSWKMNGSSSFFMRSFNVFADQMIGPAFESGLADLKEVAEAEHQAMVEAKADAAKMLEVKEVNFEPIKYYGVKDQVAFESMGPEFFEKRYGELAAYLGDDFKNLTGAPMAIYHVWDTENKMAEVEVALPANSKRPGDVRVKKNTTFGGTALQVDFYGPYEKTGKAHDAIAAYATNNNYEITGAPIEIYVTDPSTEADTAKWLTEVIYPVAKK